jgi:hypothetical protein
MFDVFLEPDFCYSEATPPAGAAYERQKRNRLKWVRKDEEQQQQAKHLLQEG